MNASKKLVSDVFNGGRILEIPFFQRAYVWDDAQWERLLDDMELISKSNKPYFLGSVILKQKPTTTSETVGDVRSVVDGQQRLTTLSIFFKVLCLHTGDAFKFDGRFRILNKEKDIALRHNHHDIDSFNKVLDLNELIELNGNGKIIECYNYFRKHISKRSLDYDRIMNNIMFVGIDLDEKEDEQQIFDTINSLGVRLTVAELLKNFFFGREDVEDYETNWKPIFEKDDETVDFWEYEVLAGRQKRQNIELFFYAFLQIKINAPNIKVKTEDKLVYTKFDGLFESYKSFIENYNIDKKEIIQEIKEYATLYYDDILYSDIEEELPEEAGIERINTLIFGLENTTLIPYVLYVLKNTAPTDDNVEIDEERNKIFEILESYIMRRIICRASNKNYNQLFTDRFIGRNIKTSKDLKAYLDSLEGQVNYMPSHKEVSDGFQNSKIINRQTRGILYMLESKIRDRSSQSTALLGLTSYSLEHLMPKKWENNWEKLDTEEAKINRNRKLLTLGNLAIITSSLNSSIRDANWETKLNGRGERGGLKRFARGIETMGDFLERSEWNEEIIEERARFLAHNAIKVWKN
ncbi:DUF262 domain-containing protein [Olleya aquimaris]|uniref:Uncharacterized protein with ParB-like and HNH nuclease domain n=1 Tax=Olleya aquimaris TaxID=639310 RepID=A0A327RJG4_9FLAO|nr:DUF262 domain-containing protein [Olleya aquimaris]RAJ16368.1 uncharacterized protein with ParB-like and HNH nuclease domain [Olleya aquimaris]